MDKDNTRHNYNILNRNFFNNSVIKDDTAPEHFVAVKYITSGTNEHYITQKHIYYCETFVCRINFFIKFVVLCKTKPLLLSPFFSFCDIVWKLKSDVYCAINVHQLLTTNNYSFAILLAPIKFLQKLIAFSKEASLGNLDQSIIKNKINIII